MKAVWHKGKSKHHAGYLSVLGQRLIFFSVKDSIELEMNNVRLIELDSKGIKISGYINKPKKQFVEYYFELPNEN